VGCWVKRGVSVRWSKIPGAGGRSLVAGLALFACARLRVISDMTMGGTSNTAQSVDSSNEAAMVAHTQTRIKRHKALESQTFSRSAVQSVHLPVTWVASLH
jgi:hypothetical protein